MDTNSLLIDNTPWEQYDIDDTWPVWVKREDLCCPDPSGPHFSKIRGVVSYLTKFNHDTTMGVLDTYHSKAGRGVAYLCHHLGLKCIVFYPVYKDEYLEPGTPSDGWFPDHKIRMHQQVAANLGAQIVPLQAGRSCVLYHQAKKVLAQMTDDRGVMMPNGLCLQETVVATAMEARTYTPDDIYAKGTWVVSISSGTICAGVVRGLYNAWEQSAVILAHMGYSRSKDAARKYITQMAGVIPGDNLRFIDENYAYKDGVDNADIPFPCNEYYDAKAWLWLIDNIEHLEQPVVFWNIGA